jgi:hypothetical protein
MAFDGEADAAGWVRKGRRVYIPPIAMKLR